VLLPQHALAATVQAPGLSVLLEQRACLAHSFSASQALGHFPSLPIKSQRVGSAEYNDSDSIFCQLDSWELEAGKAEQ